jgi:hypothetical protein
MSVPGVSSVRCASSQRGGRRTCMISPLMTGARAPKSYGKSGSLTGVARPRVAKGARAAEAARTALRSMVAE